MISVSAWAGFCHVDTASSANSAVPSEVSRDRLCGFMPVLLPAHAALPTPGKLQRGTPRATNKQGAGEPGNQRTRMFCLEDQAKHRLPGGVGSSGATQS